MTQPDAKNFHLPTSLKQKGIHLFQGLTTTDREDTPYWFGVIYIVVTTYLKNKISLLFVSFIYAVYFIAFPQGSWKTSIELEWTIILTCKFANLIRRLGLCHFAFLFTSFSIFSLWFWIPATLGNAYSMSLLPYCELIMKNICSKSKIANFQ